MSDDEPRDDEVTYGTIRRCRVHPMALDCQASRDDCLVELMPTGRYEVGTFTENDIPMERSHG